MDNYLSEKYADEMEYRVPVRKTDWIEVAWIVVITILAAVLLFLTAHSVLHQAGWNLSV